MTTKDPIDPKRIAARKNEKSARVIKTTAESAKKRDMESATAVQMTEGPKNCAASARIGKVMIVSNTT